MDRPDSTQVASTLRLINTSGEKFHSKSLSSKPRLVSILHKKLPKPLYSIFELPGLSLLDFPLQHLSNVALNRVVLTL